MLHTPKEHICSHVSYLPVWDFPKYVRCRSTKFGYTGSNKVPQFPYCRIPASTSFSASQQAPGVLRGLPRGASPSQPASALTHRLASPFCTSWKSVCLCTHRLARPAPIPPLHLSRTWLLPWPCRRRRFSTRPSSHGPSPVNLGPRTPFLTPLGWLTSMCFPLFFRKLKTQKDKSTEYKQTPALPFVGSDGHQITLQMPCLLQFAL